MNNVKFLNRDDSYYKQNVNPISDYISGAVDYVSRMMDLDKVTSLKLVKEALSKSKIRDPIVRHTTRDEFGDRHETRTSVLTYIANSIKNDRVIVPSFTTYDSAKKNPSPQVDFVNINLANRTAAKNKMKIAKANNNKDDFIYYKVLQGAMKIYNNSLSGAYSVMSTCLYNASAHFTLTTITRAAASIGNMQTEMIVAGNRLYSSYEIVIESIAMTVTNIDTLEMETIISKYNVTIPTIDDVMKCILRSSRLYWESEKLENRIEKYVSKLNDIELCAVMYVNDFYSLSILNGELVRNILRSISTKRKNNKYDGDQTPFTGADSEIANLVAHICSVELSGKNPEEIYGKNNHALMSILTETAKGIVEGFNKYNDLLTAFMATSILPVNIVDIKDLLRRAIGLSDTDSTCSSNERWPLWFYGRQVSPTYGLPITAAVLTIVSLSTSHHIREFTSNMNVDPDNAGIISMKPEFYWEVFVPGNSLKHYFSTAKIVEMIVNKETQLEVKGVHFLANNIPVELQDAAVEMMNEIAYIISKGERLDASSQIKKVIELENKIVSDLESGIATILRTDSVKEEDAYKQKKEESKYRAHILWTDVFSEQYGDITPPYTTYAIPVTLKGATAINKYMESGKGSPEIKSKILKFINTYYKGGMTTINLPMAKLEEASMPVEIIEAIDMPRAVSSVLNVFYIILETIGFYRKPGVMIRDH